MKDLKARIHFAVNKQTNKKARIHFSYAKIVFGISFKSQLFFNYLTFLCYYSTYFFYYS